MAQWQQVLTGEKCERKQHKH